MARCGCGGLCSCIIQGHPDFPVQVTGAGTASNPYLIAAGSLPFEVITDFGDAIFVGYSKAFRASSDITLAHLSAHVFALSTADIVFNLLRNGLVIATFTLPANTQAVAFPGLSYDYDEGDLYQLYVTAAGAGGLGLVVQGAFT